MRWKAGGTSYAGFSNLWVAGPLRVHHSERPMQRLHTIGLVDELLRTGRPVQLGLEMTHTVLVY